MRTEFLYVSVLRVASGPRVKLASCKSALFFVVVFLFCLHIGACAKLKKKNITQLNKTNIESPR